MTTNTPIDIRAITWNIGSKKPKLAAIEALTKQMIGADVIAVATQEEKCSKDAQRLHNQMLAKLNALHTGVYKIVTIDDGADTFRETSAGGALSGQHTRTTLIVKEPYKFDPNPTVTITDDHESKQSASLNRHHNKTIIDIAGTLTNGSGNTMDINFGSGHLESNAESSRRVHTDEYLETMGVKTTHNSSFDELVAEAARVRVFMGDTNERDLLMADGSTRNPGETMAMRGFGYDTHELPHSTKNGHNEANMEGSYGVEHDGDGNQIHNASKKASSRPHVTEGGHLDRIAIAAGRKVTTSTYATLVDGADLNKKGKLRYWGSDHAPVVRQMKVSVETSKAQMVTNLITARLPDFTDDIERRKHVIKEINKAYADHEERRMPSEAVMEGLKSVRLYDRQALNSNNLLKKAFGITSVDTTDLAEVISTIKTEIAKREVMQSQVQTIKATAQMIAATDPSLSDPAQQAWMTSVFNKVTACNIARNDDAIAQERQPEIMSEYKTSLGDLTAPEVLPEVLPEAISVDVVEVAAPEGGEVIVTIDDSPSVEQVVVRVTAAERMAALTAAHRTKPRAGSVLDPRDSITPMQDDHLDGLEPAPAPVPAPRASASATNTKPKSR